MLNAQQGATAKFVASLFPGVPYVVYIVPNAERQQLL